MEQLTERERGRLQADTKKVEAAIEELSKQLAVTEAKIESDTAKVEKLREHLKLKTTELSEWSALQAEKEQDEMILQKYGAQDEARMKHLTMQIQQRRETLQKRKHELSQQV